MQQLWIISITTDITAMTTNVIGVDASPFGILGTC